MMDGECLQISPVLFPISSGVWHDSTAIRSLDRSYSEWQTNLKTMWCTCRSSAKFSFAYETYCYFDLPVAAIVTTGSNPVKPMWSSCENHVRLLWMWNILWNTLLNEKSFLHKIKRLILPCKKKVWNCNMLFRTEKAVWNNVRNIPWL